jgi:hypothetical protein
MSLSKHLSAMAIAVATLLRSPHALGWASVGHEAIAYIAQDRLTPAARRAVKRILGPNVGLSDVANWADQVRVTSRPETAAWHFIDIPDRALSVTESDEPKYCGAASCIVSEIGIEIQGLSNPSTGPLERAELLRFLVHFVGDVHQPLHCADDGDRGGNDKIVIVMNPRAPYAPGNKTKLHALWDLLVEVEPRQSPRDLATALEQKLTDAQQKVWSTGTAADWAWESYNLAREAIYGEFAPGPTGPDGVALPRDYASTKMRDIVDAQLEKAGVRLAWVLNGLFKS